MTSSLITERQALINERGSFSAAADHLRIPRPSFRKWCFDNGLTSPKQNNAPWPKLVTDKMGARDPLPLWDLVMWAARAKPCHEIIIAERWEQVSEEVREYLDGFEVFKRGPVRVKA